MAESVDKQIDDIKKFIDSRLSLPISFETKKILFDLYQRCIQKSADDPLQCSHLFDNFLQQLESDINYSNSQYEMTILNDKIKKIQQRIDDVTKKYTPEIHECPAKDQTEKNMDELYKSINEILSEIKSLLEGYLVSSILFFFSLKIMYALIYN
jgi:hypothetical protein